MKKEYLNMLLIDFIGMVKGLVHVYTGDGKGKTTTALGIACRARGNNLKVAYVSFHKNYSKWENGDVKAMKELGIESYEFANVSPFIEPTIDLSEVRGECLDGLHFVELLYKKGYDMIIMDELNVSIKEGFLTEKEVLNVIQKKPDNLELIITGRDAPKSVIKMADLVSEILFIKHPFDKGISARKGIEF
jgi:cob(I)alamin adenosyltransferase